MTPNLNPIFTRDGVIGKANISTANTTRDGSGTLASLIIGGLDCTRITRITIKATVTTTAGMVRLFIDDGAGAITGWREIVVTAITVSAFVAGFESTIFLPGESALILPPGYILKVGTHNAENFAVTAEGGDY